MNAPQDDRTPHDAPILLLDVDGVVNALQAQPPDGWMRRTFRGYAICWDPTVTARLREWHDAGRVEIQWLTTWAHAADALLAGPMGLPRGLVTHSEPDAVPTGFGTRREEQSGWWKLPFAREVAEAAPGRRIVWIDDDLGAYDPATVAWLAANPQVLAVAPDLVVGLTHAELDAIEEWL